MNPMKIFQQIMQFANMTKQQHGNDLDPAQMSQNMMGQNFSSSQEALQELTRRGVINQNQYNMFLKML